MTNRIKIFNITELLDVSVSFLYFTVGDIGRAVSIIGIPRFIPYLIYIPMLAVCMLKHFKRFRILDCAYAVLVIPVVLYGLIRNYQYIANPINVYSSIIVFLPSYFFFRIMDAERIQKGLKAFAMFSSVFQLLYYWFVLRFEDGYSMNFGYNVAIPMCLMIYFYIHDRKIIRLLLALLLFISLVLYGSRGALGLSLVCAVYYIVLQSDNKKIKIILAILSIALVYFIFFENLNIDNALENMSGNSRIIKKFISGEFMVSKTRDVIYDACKDIINKNPYGNGPLSSRKLLQWVSYPHSILYELQIDYGKVFGFLLSTAFFAMGIYNLIYCRNKEIQALIGITEIIGLGSLVVSGSLYYDNTVPATIALFYNAIVQNRQTTVSYTEPSV